MHTSNTLSQVHVSHSFIIAKVLIVLKFVGRALRRPAADLPRFQLEFLPAPVNRHVRV